MVSRDECATQRGHRLSLTEISVSIYLSVIAKRVREVRNNKSSDYADNYAGVRLCCSLAASVLPFKKRRLICFFRTRQVHIT